MSDVSKTNEALLAKVMDTLAYYQCRANNPKADHPIQGYHAFSEEKRDHLREKQREGAEEIARMCAATRVPVRGEPTMNANCMVDADGCEAGTGEPNDDREALLRAILRGRKKRQDWWSFTEDVSNSPSDDEFIADAILAAGFSRPTVPDAATELQSIADAELLRMQRNDIIRLTAERDAATAAIERVRDILNRDDFGDDWEHDEWVYPQAAEKQLADIEAALGGEIAGRAARSINEGERSD